MIYVILIVAVIQQPASKLSGAISLLEGLLCALMVQ